MYKTITYDNNKFNHYVVYEDGQICKILKDGEHRPLKYTLGKKGSIKVTPCNNTYRKFVSVNHVTATEFLKVAIGEFDTVEPIDGDYTNTHKNNLMVNKKHKQTPSRCPKKKDGALRYCRICDYRAEKEEQLEDFVQAGINDGAEFGKRNLCKSCRQAQRNVKNGGTFSNKVKSDEAHQNRRSYLENREARLRKVKEWAENNRGKSNSYKAKNKKERALRVPKRLTEDDKWMMQQAYLHAQAQTERHGIQFHVDHIIPLQGKTVSGLHVPSNLQVIPWYENLEKSNKFTA